MDASAILERDLQIVEASAADLKAHLLGETIYWTLNSQPTTTFLLPKGTLGGLLLRLHRLNALRHRLDSGRQERLQEAASQAEQALAAWRTQAEEKARREARARLRAWATYLEECEADPVRHQHEYPTQAEGRTALAFLLDFTKAVREDISTPLEHADGLLRRIAAPAAFIWAPEMQAAYPPETFWWLYVHPTPRPQEEE